MAKVIWTKRAFGQLERNIKYIKEEQGNSYAETVLDKILSSTALLEGTPKMGRVEPLLEHKKSEYRFIVVWSYKIIYRVASDHVTISRVFHTSRNPNKLKGV
ncbi:MULTISPECIES: type II toxin-antitoxin system RelE/ParE family toxin [Ekhidna]|jgi:toxin ParE1/3/4|uniref:Plasmid stabilization system protein ParE n=1 Tax=Ekhidna lutea TaxID=447679 RepID=A0A239EMB7_EKHLU|nr:type II toxin-antitoxin system RelE/ParE family toxin [Ekhidna lutea]SNS45163.1 Plasmid stabilization system protein ParE [Ekhidna lutea]